MSGIYIHIPFCHSACSYCNFHFSTSKKYYQDIINAILKEVELRQDYLSSSKVDSIYFGGGTPSILTSKNLDGIIHKLSDYFTWDNTAEITIECNPEDINIGYLSELKNIGFNRISLGIQTFNDTLLHQLNRNHNAAQSIQSIENIIKSGFQNFTLDLIYGIPNQSNQIFLNDIHTALSFSPPHVSAYQLTIEEKTQIYHKIRKREIASVAEEQIIEQYYLLIDCLEKSNYLHYEISNFAKEGYLAKHNSSYWKGSDYLGIGPSAHSYNGIERQWNIANNQLYIKYINENKPFFEKEVLTPAQKYNEYILTRLRTQFGCSINEIESLFGMELKKHFLKVTSNHTEYFNICNDRYILNSKRGYLIADKITAELFI